MFLAMKIDALLYVFMIHGVTYSHCGLLGSIIGLGDSETDVVPSSLGDPGDMPITNAGLKTGLNPLSQQDAAFQEITSSVDLSRGSATALAAQSQAGITLQTTNGVVRTAAQATPLIEPLTCSDCHSLTLALIEPAMFITDDLKKTKNYCYKTIDSIVIALNFAQSALATSELAILAIRRAGINNLQNDQLQASIKPFIDTFFQMINELVVLILQMSQSLMPGPAAASNGTLVSSATSLEMIAEDMECRSYNVTLTAFPLFRDQ